MKKFTKLFLSCTAVAAITAALATSAMAADPVALKSSNGIEGTYDTETGVVSLTTLPNADDAIKTVLVLKPSEVSASDTGITVVAENIIGIDQTAELTEVKLDASKVNTENNNYTVLVGGSSGKVYTATFGAGGAGILMGDVNATGDVDGADALAIVRHSLEMPGAILTGDNLAAADVNETKDVDGADALCIIRYSLEMPGSGIAGQIK